MLLRVLWGAFSANNLLIFFLFFECSALIIFCIIAGWGYQPERLPAAVSLLLYTSLAALPMVSAIFWLDHHWGISQFFHISIYLNSGGNILPLTGVLSLGFIVKFPLFFFHLWLPKAHVEASAAGSQLLAGVLLKLGAFGIFRFAPLLPLPERSAGLTWALWGGAVLSIVCSRAKDFKVLIAYSSVVHISIVIASLLTKTPRGARTALFLVLAHAISSAFIFFLAGELFSWRNTRQIILSTGVLSHSPLFSAIWTLGTLANMGTPPLVNFWRELLRLICLANFCSKTLPPLIIIFFFCVAYSIVLLGSTQMGRSSPLFIRPLIISAKSLRNFIIHGWALLIISIFLSFFAY